MKTMKKCVREYLNAHNNTVTSQEVINYILEEKGFKTKKSSITRTLRCVLKEEGGTLKPYGVKEEILNYVKTHNNTVSSQEVVDYILVEKKIKTTESYIRNALVTVLKEVDGTLKPYGVKEEILNYVKSHKNTVSSQEVVDYILKEKKIKTKESYIRVALGIVLKEVGGSYIKNNCN